MVDIDGFRGLSPLTALRQLESLTYEAGEEQDEYEYLPLTLESSVSAAAAAAAAAVAGTDPQVIVDKTWKKNKCAVTCTCRV